MKKFKSIIQLRDELKSLQVELEAKLTEVKKKQAELQTKQTELEQTQAGVEDKQSQLEKLESLMEENVELVESVSEGSNPSLDKTLYGKETPAVKAPASVKKERPAKKPVQKPVQKQVKEPAKAKEEKPRYKDFSSLKV